MTPQLQQVIIAARALSPRDKLELLEVISRDLQQNYAFEEESAAFWSSRSLEEMEQMQITPIITDIRTLAVDFWPEDESADDFNEFIAARRQADRMRDT
ncbi:MAG: hypothetical protein H0T73_10115 [Ardenticatenales bacterium]|nr:hypothetical protein [Ardenticatenales bacterium]